MSAANAYDALAPHYREYAKRRSAYLDAVDRLILESTPRPAGHLLDVGAGDGVRGMRLARELGATRVVLCEPSAAMADYCRRLAPDAVWECAAQDLPATDERFDVVLCLWNVLGHLPDRAARVAALRAMRMLMQPGGSLFLDVNNRHNSSAYGLWRVLGRRLVDFVAPDERRGDAVFEWKIAERGFPAAGHLFTPAEIESLIEESGLTVCHRCAVNYATGVASASPFRGQLVYRTGIRPAPHGQG